MSGGKSRPKAEPGKRCNAPAAAASVHSRCGPSLTTVEDIKGGDWGSAVACRRAASWLAPLVSPEPHRIRGATLPIVTTARKRFRRRARTARTVGGGVCKDPDGRCAAVPYDAGAGE